MDHLESLTRVIIVAAVATGAIACSQTPPVAVYDPKYAFPVPGSDGFYAFLTPLPATAISEVELMIAPVHDLAGALTLSSEQDLVIYRRSSTEYVGPDTLEQLFASSAGAVVQEPSEDHVVLGLLVVEIAPPPKSGWGSNDSEAGTLVHESGISLSSLPPTYREIVEEALEQMAESAAAYGADAVTRIRMHKNRLDEPEGVSVVRDGWWALQGQAIAYVE